MLKKLFLGALFLGLTSILIIGAVNRTTAKNNDTDVHQTQGQGQGWARQATANETIANVSARGTGQGRNQVETLASSAGQQGRGQRSATLETTAGAGQGAGQRGQQAVEARGNGQGRQGGTAASTVAWEVLQGPVLSIDDDQMTILAENGDFQVTDRGWRYALEQGFSAQVGDQVQVSGFYENGEFEMGQMLNLSREQQVQVREESGRPLWAGGQGGSGQSVPIAETEDHEWVVLEGTVTSIDSEQLTVLTGDGEIQIVDRPWDFAQSQGFTAAAGDWVTLNGFYEDGQFELGSALINGQLVEIREESGRPLWAGGSGRGRWS